MLGIRSELFGISKPANRWVVRATAAPIKDVEESKENVSFHVKGIYLYTVIILFTSKEV